MPGLLVSQEGVFFLHAGIGSFDRRIAARDAARSGAALFDPAPEAVGIACRLALRTGFGGGAKPFDIDELADLLGIKPGKARRHVAAQRMGHDGHLVMSQRVDQLGKVIDEGIYLVIAVRRPGAVAMTAQVRRDDVPVLGQFLGHPVPAAAMVAPAMLKDQRRGIGIAPIDIVEAQALRDEAVGGRSVRCHANSFAMKGHLRQSARQSGGNRFRILWQWRGAVLICTAKRRDS